MDTLLQELTDQLVRWASSAPHDARLAQARTSFEERTAPIEVDHPDYEARIGHFLDWYVCEYTEDNQPPPVAAFAEAHPSLGAAERRALAGLLRSQRSLLRVHGAAQGTLLLHDLLTDARFELAPELAHGRLGDGEVFDGRVVSSGRGLTLAPGRVFHAADTHAAVLQLVERSEARRLPRARLLNALLAMRDRRRRFTGLRPEHLYTLDAVGKGAFSATWIAER